MSNQRDFILLDRSGSMNRHWDETLTAVNAYVKQLAAEETPTLVTFATFDGAGGFGNAIVPQLAAEFIDASGF